MEPFQLNKTKKRQRIWGTRVTPGLITNVGFLSFQLESFKEEVVSAIAKSLQHVSVTCRDIFHPAAMAKHPEFYLFIYFRHVMQVNY